ncbi:MAG: hypothetical protein ACK4UO_14000 [Pseudolabrys sp.]
MRKLSIAMGLLAMAAALGAAQPASAEFFGCNDNGKGKVLATYTSGSRTAAQGHSYRAGSGHTREFAAQSTRPNITVYPRSGRPGPNAKRHCRSWLAKEYRVSGTVIVPRMQCWWE